MKASKPAIVLSLTLSLFGCVAGTLHENIPLVWKPTNDVYGINSATLTGMYEQKIRIEPFVDSRENRQEIAKYVEDDRNMPVTTKDDVGAWCAERFRAIARQFGLSVVDGGESVNIKGEVLQFYVTEDKLYKGIVGIKLTVSEAKGTRLWQGMMTGTSRRFGRSYSKENYYETLSDAYLEAVHGLLKNEDFRKAVQKAD